VGEPTTLDLLEHYGRREPCLFLQFDGHKVVGRDDVLRPDENGHSVTSGLTYELMSGRVAVRVLIPKDVADADAVALLLKIAHEIERDGLQHRYQDCVGGWQTPPDISDDDIFI